MKHYLKHLPKQVNSLLEIGCLHGESLRMWRDLYPQANLHTVDLFEENVMPDDIENLKCWKGSQTDELILDELKKIHFDVIIEDGSHASKHQLITFFSLIGNCDLYVVEDLFCCEEIFYRDGLPFEGTMLGMMKANKFPFPFKLYEDKIAFITKE